MMQSTLQKHLKKLQTLLTSREVDNKTIEVSINPIEGGKCAIWIDRFKGGYSKSESSTAYTQIEIDKFALETASHLNLQWRKDSTSLYTYIKEINVRIVFFKNRTGNVGLTARNLSNKINPIGSFGITDDIKKLLTEIKEKKLSVAIAGQTGSGKTSFLNSVLQNYLSFERIIVIQDISEIKLPNTNSLNYVLETFIGDDRKQQEMDDYSNMIIRLNLDRIILGELNQYNIKMIMSLINSGHAGVFTMHAGSAEKAFTKLVQQYSIASGSNFHETKDMIKSIIDIVLHIDRKGSNFHFSYLDNITQ